MNRIEGERVELVELGTDRAKSLIAGAREIHWSAEYPFDGTKIAAGMLLNAVDDGLWKPGFGMYQIVRSEDGLVVGDVGFHAAPDENGMVEIGYELVPEARGAGLATDAVLTIVGWAMGQPGVARVEAETTIVNTDSQAVLNRSGFEIISTNGQDIRYRFKIWLGR
ncbi:GNAT family N-acetyltransferase [Glycomyces sp. L485]|uniref:GNAT family N-acetyltransferase n=1 Tax=Glycomyces sp. L485 TaxID=2909235 RepID=UPI001F4A0EB9|nr:GNAT family N-acetyltransferase [Glycomyces sp. L485]MCH7231936.1 GNAT family N-acetyltransferase [Glycomyces sp. L485]